MFSNSIGIHNRYTCIIGIHYKFSWQLQFVFVQKYVYSSNKSPSHCTCSPGGQLNINVDQFEGQTPESMSLAEQGM